MAVLGNESIATVRSWYCESILNFLAADATLIVGHLITKSDFDVLQTQRDAWILQIDILKAELAGLNGTILLEYSVPRMGRRIDCVLLIGPVVFVVEFKVGRSKFDSAAVDQAWDYALDLKNFHEASHHASIVPILVATKAKDCAPKPPICSSDGVFTPILASMARLRESIDECLRCVTEKHLDSRQWINSSYAPTPTIIEAARTLYAQHSVNAIARHDAGAKNLRETSQYIEQVIDDSRQRQRKAICFVTGVPGAGKTLVGLNIATLRRDKANAAHAVFLSGNGPLVAVLREALTRDEVARQKQRSPNPEKKGRVEERIKAFIQNIHHFRDELLIGEAPPLEHVAIFDEAQRAWDLPQTASFMRRKRNRPDFALSESELLISGMDRHTDWAVIVCLVGGGQDINTGESGIHSWLDAIETRFPDWDVHSSPRLSDSEYGATAALERLRLRPSAYLDDALHLDVSLRSFRAESVSAYVGSLIECHLPAACEELRQLQQRYPIAITRDLQQAKQWVLNRARGTERFGVIASSKAQRLKPDAIDIRVDVNPIHWFLNDSSDTRSSYYLEDAATEFQVQGLELDWACVAWDADLRYSPTGWKHWHFRGNRWCQVAKHNARRYLRNAYRVLLTRARQGMVIYVPRGNPNDATRLPEFYDSTYQYLIDTGIAIATD